ncbi:hypothetical protein [Cyanobium sp. Copco_Reservoir_LC18]|uniref:hypothetical protein n=1 Tax=Cyanobium sp. Copco_Reservoir_LC18 TaxID=1328305 RepID=UPI00135BA07C|nr:hypothetical protein [Cyanobium sp. Copco_Reservoir_LC18]
MNSIDKLVIAWAFWVVFAGFFHKFTPGSGPVYALGTVYNATVPYFLFRIWCRSRQDLEFMICAIAVILVPVAIAMWIEQTTMHNIFAIFGGVSETPMIREGRVRASGPFAHPILAGSVGATCLPLIAFIWKSHRALSILGILSCFTMVLASASSGPLMSLIFGIFALCIWRFRSITKYSTRGFIVVYILLSFVMKQPPYYLIGRIDLTGGSTGWHRSYLIDMFIVHFHEWWAFGTDRTKHWVPLITGPTPEHTDITNAYIGYAVVAGLPALLIFLAILWRAFSWVGIAALDRTDLSSHDRFATWCLGSALFAHATTMLSVVYFDQTLVFLWATIAIISSFHSIPHQQYQVVRLLRYPHSGLIQTITKQAET